jgi:hypothetical protein
MPGSHRVLRCLAGEIAELAGLGHDTSTAGFLVARQTVVLGTWLDGVHTHTAS